MPFIGIDVSKQRLHAAWLRDPQQGLTPPNAVDNTPAGQAQLLSWAQRCRAAPAVQRHFVLEATGVYHGAIALFLHQAGAEVAVSNPLHIKRCAESRGIKTKNDRQDGHDLALYGHERRPPAWQPPPAPVRDLRALYPRLIQTGTSKMSAAGAAMRKLVPIAFGVFKHQQPYPSLHA